MFASEQLEAKLKDFQCRQCNRCCEQKGYVFLTDEDVTAMANFLKRTVDEFVSEFCEIWQRQRLVLKARSDDSCIFLTPEGCSVYSARPEQCRDFPMKWRTDKSLAYCEGIRELLR